MAGKFAWRGMDRGKPERPVQQLVPSCALRRRYPDSSRAPFTARAGWSNEAEVSAGLSSELPEPRPRVGQARHRCRSSTTGLRRSPDIAFRTPSVMPRNPCHSGGSGNLATCPFHLRGGAGDVPVTVPRSREQAATLNPSPATAARRHMRVIMACSASGRGPECILTGWRELLRATPVSAASPVNHRVSAATGRRQAKVAANPPRLRSRQAFPAFQGRNPTPPVEQRESSTSCL